MDKLFNSLLNNYLLDKSKLVDSSKEYYIDFKIKTPDLLYQYFNKDKYLIEASVGHGQRSEIPWLCIFNRNITKTATKGLYMCYLFKKDMSGFYLTLCQGITTFEELFGKNKNEYAVKVADYFKTLINDDNFSKDKIDLLGDKKLSKGYESGTIISKYYDKDNYSNIELITDLLKLKRIYDDICESLNDCSYMEIVSNVVNNLDASSLMINEANRVLDKAIIDISGEEELDVVTLEMVNIPKTKQNNTYQSITERKIKKVDYEKKQKSNIKNGFQGEKLVLYYEQERLKELGREDLANSVKWVSTEDDSVGYDILSFDIDDNNEVKEKYIEVKTTDSGDNSTFFISMNEVNTFKKYKEQYNIYRVFNINKSNPKVFVINYDDFINKIDLTIANYIAKINNV